MPRRLMRIRETPSFAGSRSFRSSSLICPVWQRTSQAPHNSRERKNNKICYDTDTHTYIYSAPNESQRKYLDYNFARPERDVLHNQKRSGVVIRKDVMNPIYYYVYMVDVDV